MHWSAYEVFSVLSGASLLIGTLVGSILEADLSAKDRLFGFFGGIAMIGYGFYVAGQTEGVFVFPVGVFIVPFVFTGWIVVQIVQASGRKQLRERPAATSGDPDDVPGVPPSSQW
jgi:predicted MFS family arabinose efflux permease